MPASWESLWDSFQLALEADGREPRTVEAYRETLVLLGRYLEEHELGIRLTLGRIEVDHLRRFMAWRLANSAPRTALHDYRGLSRFFGWLTKEEEIPANPMEKMQPPKVEETPVPVLSVSDIRRILAACEGRADIG